MSARLLLSVVLLTLAGGASTRDEGSARPELDFEFAGCVRVRPGPVCELGPERDLTLWASGGERLELAGAARADSRTTRFVEGGWQLKLRVPRAARAVEVRAGDRRGELRVLDSSEPAPLRELARLWKAGDWQQVRASLETTSQALEGPERERIRAFRARLALRDGDNARATAELEQSAERAHEAGLLIEASNDWFAAAYGLAVRLGKYDHARALLERTERELSSVPETRARLPYYFGVLAKATGDTQGALVQFRKSSLLSRRLDVVSEELLARQELALLLNRLHRHTEALAEQEAVVLREVDGPGCLHSLRWENLAWILLSQSDPSLLTRASTALDRAEELHERCPDPLSRRNQALNRAKLALLRGDAAASAARLRALEADTTGRSARLAAWQALYTGQLHLLRGSNAEALAAFERADRLSDGILLEDCAYLAKLGRARALLPTNAGDAVAAYLRAEDAADALVRSAPFGQGQQLAALQVQESSRELLSLLLDRGMLAEAHALTARAARRAWASSFRASRIAALSGARRERWERAVSEYVTRRRALERAALDDWKLSAEGLSETRLSRALEGQELEKSLADAYGLLAEGRERTPTSFAARASDAAELTLAAGKEGFWAFLSRDGALRAAPVARHSSLREVGRGLALALEQFHRERALDGTWLRVALPPELAALDVHALEVFGRPVAERVPVAYSFESSPEVLPESGERSAAAALVVGDPNQDLPWADAEAKRLAKRLPGARALLGDQVTFEAVARHLPDANLLHFAGHASSGGLDGLDGALELGEDQRLSLGDVFSLRRVPEFVVLSACTSSVSPESGGGLSIGQAFVAAGSRAVVGASRAVSDSVAQRFVRAFYDALLDSGSGATLPRDGRAWAAAVRTAGLKVKHDDPVADWASMRLLLP